MKASLTPGETISGIRAPALSPNPSKPHLPASLPADLAESALLAPLPARHRRGAIARLPKDLRTQVNKMLDDGSPYGQIVAFLSTHGHAVSADSVRSWKNGGYQEWRCEQQSLEESQLRHLLTLNFASQDQGLSPFQATHRLAAAYICRTIANLGDKSLRQAIQSDPLNVIRILNSLTRLTRSGLECHRNFQESNGN